MTEQEILKAKMRYAELNKRREELLKKRTELEELENSETYRKILELRNELNHVLIPSEDQTIWEAFTFVAANSAAANKVFVYLGTFLRRFSDAWSFHEESLKYDDETAKYSAYINLETMAVESVRVAERKVFESNHNVIFHDKVEVYNSNAVNQIRLWFFKNLLTESQNIVVRKLMLPETINDIIGE